MEALQDWELKDLRGFSMQRGHRSRVVHKKGRKQNSSEEVLPGRTSFKRKAGGTRCPARCGMCRPGRYHRAGGAKASKKVGCAVRGVLHRLAWLDVVQEARLSQRAIVSCADVVSYSEEQVSSWRSKSWAAVSPVPVAPVPVAPRKAVMQIGELRGHSGAQLCGKFSSCKCCGPASRKYGKQVLPRGKDEEYNGFVLCRVPSDIDAKSLAADNHALGNRPGCVLC